MRLLVIGEDQRKEIRELLSFARANRFSLQDMIDKNRAFRSGNSVAIGDDPRWRREIPHGFRVVYSEEQHPGGLMRHLSVSINAAWKTPHPMAICSFLRLFQFRNTEFCAELLVYPENLDAGRRSINILEKILPTDEIPN